MSVTRRDDVVLTHENGIVVATHEPSGIASQGESEPEALEALADALRLASEEISEADRDEAEVPDSPWF